MGCHSLIHFHTICSVPGEKTYAADANLSVPVAFCQVILCFRERAEGCVTIATSFFGTFRIISTLFSLFLENTQCCTTGALTGAGNGEGMQCIGLFERKKYPPKLSVNLLQPTPPASLFLHNDGSALTSQYHCPPIQMKVLLYSPIGAEKDSSGGCSN